MFWWRCLAEAPLSIKIAVWLLIAQGAIAGGATVLGVVAGGVPMGVAAILAFSLYGMVALSRSSFWPIAILAVAFGVGWAVGPELGGISPTFAQHGLAEALVLAVLVLPHARRMNWKPLGIEPLDRPPLEDLFD